MRCYDEIVSRSRTLFLAAAALLPGCGSRDAKHALAPKGSLRAVGVNANPDPTVKGARLLPGTLDEDRAYGIEPGGGVRLIVAGMRVVSMPSGAVLASP